MKEIFINSDKDNNEIIAIIENGKVIEQYQDTMNSKRLEGNIYVGKVTDVLEGMQAAFIDIGENKNAFLHIKDLIPKKSNVTGNKDEGYVEYNIKDYIRVGMPIVVQVKKDKTDKKGARVSTHINFPGRFVVIMPELDFVTVSQKLENSDKVENLKRFVKDINKEKHGVIIRTSAENQELDEIAKDYNTTLNEYKKLANKSNEILNSSNFVPTQIYKTPGIIKKILIDTIDQNIEKITVNTNSVYDDVKEVLELTNNNSKIELKIINESNILDIYGINEQLEKIKNRKIWLKSGGFITIDRTEALIAIDVNTGKYTGNGNLENTVFKVNEEATLEIAKQIKLRDLGGIIIIDYIDMEKRENEKKIEALLYKLLKNDRAKTQVIGFTPLHLLEMTRKHMFSEVE